MTADYQYARDAHGATYRRTPFRGTYQIEVCQPLGHTWTACDPAMRVRPAADAGPVKVRDLAWREE
jgi:hypothetical protein